MKGPGPSSCKTDPGPQDPEMSTCGPLLSTNSAKNQLKVPIKLPSSDLKVHNYVVLTYSEVPLGSYMVKKWSKKL